MKNRFLVLTSALFLIGLGTFGCTKGVVKTEVTGMKTTEAAPAEAPKAEEAPAPAKPPAVEAPPAPVPAPEITDVFFDFDRYAIRDDAVKTLENDAKIFKGNSMKVTVEGHCDERGTDEYNIALGAKRAAAVKKYLTDLGVEARRITSISYGSERPFCKEHNETCWQENRRAHITEK
jgi:peptidoglycan-associated lipoprotein